MCEYFIVVYRFVGVGVGEGGRVVWGCIRWGRIGVNYVWVWVEKYGWNLFDVVFG